MTAPYAPPASDAAARLRDAIEALAHLLPAQAPLTDFVHHNTLHAFQHLPFRDALRSARDILGGTPWWSEHACREQVDRGDVSHADIDAALRELDPAADALLAGESLFGLPSLQLRRVDVQRCALLYLDTPPAPATLRWQMEESGTPYPPAIAVTPAARARALGAEAGSPAAEARWLNALWQTTSAQAPPAQGVAAAADHDWPTRAAAAWTALTAPLGVTHTVRDLLRALTGEDLLTRVRPLLQRHCAAYLDRGLAAWRPSAQQPGLFRHWLHAAQADPAWALDELPLAQHELRTLPDTPLAALAGELERLGLPATAWPNYLQRQAMELPGWAGMLHRSAPPAGNASDDSPLTEFLAIHAVTTRLLAEDLVRRHWDLPLALPALQAGLLARPEELCVRLAYHRGVADEAWMHRVRRQLARAREWPGADHRRIWHALADAWYADTITAPPHHDWPLYVVAQHFGLHAEELAAHTTALRACLAPLDADYRGYAWLLARERAYREPLFAALSANHTRQCGHASSARPGAQVVCCMDDREEGLRRHLEETDPGIVTFGAAGFFGIAMYWRGLDDTTDTALCPVVVRPAHRVRELPQAPDAAALRTARRQRRLIWRARFIEGSRRRLLAPPVLAAIAAPVSLAVLALRTWAPAYWHALRRRLTISLDGRAATTLALTAHAAPRPATPDTPRDGLTLDEQAERVEGLLRTIGLVNNFAPLVVILGHGSHSDNNPHFAAYDCGACSGRHGGPNARVFAAMANQAEVRQRLAGRGITIPDDTWFIGAEHDTCDEQITWYDTDTLPAQHAHALARLQGTFRIATGAHAAERCRRFAACPDAPSPEVARRHVARRASDFAEPRPELGHATNAAALIGRRRMSRGIFLDRRVFLISYDPTHDADGRIAESILLAAGPVGAGINLEYYFSTVDNAHFGCGSKITHNLAGLVGVMDGNAADLRPGLPQQMIEVHEPLRLLVVVEQTPEVLDAILARQPALAELVHHGWIQLAAMAPDSGQLAYFQTDRGWRPQEATASAPPEVERGHDWYGGRRDPLRPVLLRQGAVVPEQSA